jgi:hypothetical protein
MRFDEIMAMDDTNRLSEHEPLGNTGQPITATLKFNKTVMSALMGANEAQTEETWTFTDAAGNTRAGLGFVGGVSEENRDTQSHATFTAVFQPKTEFAFTAA